MVNLLLVLVFSCIVLVGGGFVILCALSCFCFALVFVGGVLRPLAVVACF